MAHDFHLEHAWVFWYDDRHSQRDGMSSTDWENSITPLGQFVTIKVSHFSVV